MRGGSGEAIVGSGGVGGDEVGLTRQESGDGKPFSSPPLSAAASQVSLAPSDLTTSDPDIAASSAYSTMSSRPPSSSQVSLATSDLTSSDGDLVTSSLSSPSSAASSRPPSSSELAPDLVLPAPEDYTTETVEFPTSPLAIKTGDRKSTGVCFLEVDEGHGSSRSQTPSSIYLTPNYNPDDLESSENSPKQGDGFEVGSDLEEDYFEEFHLPNSHENAFVRHKSFRRKVNLTPIDAPDAEKIEGLVRTGEFQRHGSIRKKIMPDDMSPELQNHEDKFHLDSNENIREATNDDNSLISDVVGTFAKDLKEIESMLNESEGAGEDMSDIVAQNSLHKDVDSLERSKLSLDGQQSIPQANTSTPKANNTRNSSGGGTEDDSFVTNESTDYESLSIEQSTLMKVRECLDFTKYKDVYNLCGRLQDILTPMEVEEVLNNSERYSEYVNQDVIEALHNSLQEKQNSSNQSGNIDSGISSPKKTLISTEGLDLEPSIKTDIRAVADTTEEEGNEAESSVFRNAADVLEEVDLDDDEDTGFRFERRRSLRLSKEGVVELEVEGVFVESKSQDLGMKKISAPSLDLSGTATEDLSDVPDISGSENPEITSSTSDIPLCRKVVNPVAEDIKVEDPLAEDVPTGNVSVPNIVITVANDSDIEDEYDVSHLVTGYSDMSDVTTPTINSPESKHFEESSDEERPSTLDFGNLSQRKRISVAEDILRSPVDDDAISVASAFSQQSDGEEYDDHLAEDDLDLFESEELPKFKTHPDLEPLPPPPPLFIPELSASEEMAEERHWRSVVIGGVWRRIDMKVIAPYRKCVRHGGYLGEDKNAIIVICACQLPDRSRRDYNYVMDNLFLYVLSTLEQLIAEDYVLVYLAGGTPRSNMPNFHWLKQAYQMIDRKLRKNLKALHVVHPTFWVRTVVAFSRPFISTKFYRKLTFVNNLTELAQMVPLDQLDIPDQVKQADFELMIKEKKKNLSKRRTSAVTSR